MRQLLIGNGYYLWVPVAKRKRIRLCGDSLKVGNKNSLNWTGLDP